MPTECPADLFGFEAVEGRRVEAAFDGGRMTSDAGALLLNRTARAIGHASMSKVGAVIGVLPLAS